jgi:tetratricopeptide (TPR) repeat protein
VKIAGEEAKRADPARLRAYEHVLEGKRHLRKSSKEGSEQARLSNLKAIEADPDIAGAHTGLAWVYINGYRYGWTDLARKEALARARKEAQIALDLAPDNYSSHVIMASVHMQAGEREQALAEFEKSLELNPNAANVMATLAEALGYVGRFPEAIALMQKSMRLDPHHPGWFYWTLGWAQYSARECDEALATMRKMSRMPPLANRILSAIYICLGDPDKARAAIAVLRDHDPEYSAAKFRLGFQVKYKDPADLERWIDDMRKAGLPE